MASYAGVMHVAVSQLFIFELSPSTLDTLVRRLSVEFKLDVLGDGFLRHLAGRLGQNGNGSPRRLIVPR